MSEQQVNSAFKTGLKLALACIISGVAIAATYYFTQPTAEVEALKIRNKTMQDIVPQATSFQTIKGYNGWFKAEKDGETIAYIVPAENPGYGGSIKMIVGLTPAGRVITYKILNHHETPGLGNKASNPQFVQQFSGKDLEELKVVKTPTKNNIQALTGATVTSIAVTNAVCCAVEDLEDYLHGDKNDAVSQATPRTAATARSGKNNELDAKSGATSKAKYRKADAVTTASKKEKY